LEVGTAGQREMKDQIAKNGNGEIFRLGKELRSKPKLLEGGFSLYCVNTKLGNYVICN
jgi:hypothetical protein